MRKVFIEDLPKWESGTNKGKINWIESIGSLVNFIYDDIEGYVEIIGYGNRKKNYITVKYKNNILEIMTSSFIKCRIGGIINKKTKKYKVEIGKRFQDDKRDITITDRNIIEKLYFKKNNKENKNYRKWYKYTCNVCGWTEGWMLETHILKGIGCSCCASQTAVLGINTIWDTDKWMIPIVGEEFAKTHTHSCSDSIFPTCPDCGRVRDKEMLMSNIYKYHGFSCPCGDGKSYPEKFAFNFLEQLGIEFETEYSPNWIKPRRYDFYFEIDNKKYILEMDGGLGHGKKTYNKNDMSSKESKEIDDYKDIVAKEHQVKVIRINCEISSLNFIKQNILNSHIAKLFDLSNMNWLKCEEFACNSLVKVACGHKRNNPELTTFDIGRIMKLCGDTVRKYLKIGNKHDWCYYDSIEEKIRRDMLSRKINSKKIEVFKNEISVGIFNSAKEFVQKSKELFNIKVSYDGVTRACRSNKVYQGFTFKYV